MMTDVFVEYMLKKKFGPKDIAICIGALALGGVLIAGCIILMMGSVVPPMIPFFVMCAVIYGVYWLITSRQIDYEYSVTNGDISIDQIVNRKSRKRLTSFGAKAIEELRDGLESRGLLYILEPEDDEADNEDLSQLLNMVFSPDSEDDVMLGTAAPSTHQYDDEELIGGDSSMSSDEVINEKFSSYGDLYAHFSRMEEDDED